MCAYLRKFSLFTYKIIADVREIFLMNKQINSPQPVGNLSVSPPFLLIPIWNFYQKSIQLQSSYSFLTVKSSSLKNGYPISLRKSSQHVKGKPRKIKIQAIMKIIFKKHTERYVAQKEHAYVSIRGCQKIRKIKDKISVAKHNAGRQELNYVCVCGCGF